ncbi:MAG: carbohydrate ABC transporter permease [Firmicutes bacterium]|jgi:multiple sugar transport system permease protein|nr:carbohydrate ABC transporter permease [Bacillota bacterium]
MAILTKERRRAVGYKASNVAFRVFRFVLILGISYIILFPVLSKISSSFMPMRDLADQTVKWIPKHPTLDNYRLAIEVMNFPKTFFNSLFLSFLVSLLSLISSTVVGYGLARFDFKGKNLILAAAIFTLVVPPQMIMVPLYLNWRFFDIFGLIPGKGFNLLGTYWPFILTSITGTGLRNGLFILVMRQFFAGMPRNLEEAAYVDGAGPIRTFVTIMLPGAKASMVTVFLFAFVWQWNDSFLTTLYLDNNFLPVALVNLSRTLAEYLAMNDVQYFSLITNAASMLMIAPLLFMYAVLQQYFVESIERTGLVG